MKRTIVFFVVMFFSLGWLSAQNTVVSALVGCEFRDNGMSVRTKLKAKFGTKPTKDLGKEVVYSKVEIGGVRYDYAHFYFKYSNELKHSEFISALLKKQFLRSDRSKAIEYYHSLQAQYRRRYANFESLDTDTSFVSRCGKSIDGHDGQEYPIQIALEEAIARTGEKYIYVTVTYYPNELESFQDDEI